MRLDSAAPLGHGPRKKCTSVQLCYESNTVERCIGLCTKGFRLFPSVETHSTENLEIHFKND